MKEVTLFRDKTASQQRLHELVREAEETLDRIQGDLDTAPLRMVVRGVVDRDT